MPTKLSIARKISYDVFTKVLEQRLSPEELIDTYYKNSNDIKRIDKNFIKELLYGSLRWYAKLFWILQKTSSRRLESISPEARTALILGTYQIFYMDRVPDRAAVNESVEYIRFKGQASCVPFINGILRSISRRSEYFAKPNKDKQPSEYLALQYAHPKWLVQRWLLRFGFDQLKTILLSNNQPPLFCVRINSLKVSKSESQIFRQKLLKQEKTKSSVSHLENCLYLNQSPEFSHDSFFSKGYFTIQGESSQIIGHLVDPQASEVIVDACAGVGGKSSHLYELSEGKAEIIALDISKARLSKAESNVKRLGHNLSFIKQDFLSFKPKRLVDKVLLDAPCSGLGVLRKHPEGKWQKKPQELFELVKLQQKLLSHAFSILKVGGRIIFSVCSFELEETEYQLSWFKNTFSNSKVLSLRDSKLPNYYWKYITKEDVLLIYSGNKDSMDGFGAFVIIKTK